MPEPQNYIFGNCRLQDFSVFFPEFHKTKTPYATSSHRACTVFFLFLKKMWEISLCWFDAQQQTSALTQQKYSLFYVKFSAEFCGDPKRGFFPHFLILFHFPMQKIDNKSISGSKFTFRQPLECTLIFKTFEKVQATTLHWFDAQKQTSTLTQQNFSSFHMKFSAEFNELILFF